MRTKYFNSEVLFLVMVTLIPWPGPTVFKISCPRNDASTVRKLIQKKWVPVVEKYGVEIPVECPFHPARDIFGPQQAAKHRYRSSQWSCGFCGKSFYEERYLELHFDKVHRSQINVGEDAVCLAEFCDMMRCKVLVAQEKRNELGKDVDRQSNTDVDVWREATARKTALAPSAPRDLVRVFSRNGKVSSGKIPKSTSQSPLPKENQCSKSATDSGKLEKNRESKGSKDGDGNNTKDTCENLDLIDSAMPPLQKNHRDFHEFQKLKAHCKPEELSKLKERCEVLVQHCTEGLLVYLSAREYAELEEELNKNFCWYLTCERYWEDSLGDVRPFPWGMVFVLVMVLSLGICFVYYVIWVLFDSKDGSASSRDVSTKTTPSRYVNSKTRSEEYHFDSPESGDSTSSDRYIYVTYPPDLKRRLVESCYNRTTRL